MTGPPFPLPGNPGLDVSGQSRILEVLNKKQAPTVTEQHSDLIDTADLFNTLFEHDLSEGLRRVSEMILNAALIIERTAHLNAPAYARSSDRNGYANGFKTRNFHSSYGDLEIKMPQVRDSSAPFHSSLLEKGGRVDRALKATIAEMYLKGVSTRKVTAVLEKLCGLEVSTTQVSRLTAELDAEFEQWRNRPLPEIAYLYLDATFVPTRENGVAMDCAVLTAIGVRRSDGKRMVLGVSCKVSEAEVHWRDFINTLKERGIGIPDTVTSDAHEGLRAALRATLTSTPWQRCQFHLQQNASSYVPKQEMKAEVAEDIRSIFNEKDLEKATTRLTQVAESYRKRAPKLADWMETNLLEGLTVLAQPIGLHKRLRTSNCVERLNKEIKRRTKVVGVFPNENSVLRLVTSILIETSDDWETGKTYLNLN